MNNIGNQQFCDDFLRGQYDCSKGVEHKPGMGEAYDRGYAAEYALEQVMTEVTLEHH